MDRVARLPPRQVSLGSAVVVADCLVAIFVVLQSGSQHDTLIGVQQVAELPRVSKPLEHSQNDKRVLTNSIQAVYWPGFG